MSRKSRAKPPSPFLRFNSSPEVIRLVVMIVLLGLYRIRRDAKKLEGMLTRGQIPHALAELPIALARHAVVDRVPMDDVPSLYAESVRNIKEMMEDAPDQQAYAYSQMCRLAYNLFLMIQNRSNKSANLGAVQDHCAAIMNSALQQDSFPAARESVSQFWQSPA